MADAVVLNDPITGQGSNNAAKAPRSISTPSSSTAQNRSTPAGCRQRRRLLGLRPVRHRLDQRAAATAAAARAQADGLAQAFPVLARRIANGFTTRFDFFPWFAVPEEAELYLKQLAA